MLRHKRKLIIIISVILLAVFLYTQNNWIKVTSIDIESAKIQNNIRIVQITDLHGKLFGKDNKRLIGLIKKQNPDIIVFTGDLIDRSGKNITSSISTLKELQTYRPLYYIPGNHEYWSGKSEQIFKTLSKLNGYCSGIPTQGMPVLISKHGL